MVLIFICCFVTLFNKNMILSANLNSSAILDGQLASGLLIW
jgi:hypothetical protein